MLILKGHLPHAITVSGTNIFSPHNNITKEVQWSFPRYTWEKEDSNEVICSRSHNSRAGIWAQEFWLQLLPSRQGHCPVTGRYLRGTQSTSCRECPEAAMSLERLFSPQALVHGSQCPHWVVQDPARGSWDMRMSAPRAWPQGAPLCLGPLIAAEMI